jgi:serine/threonine-protein kinase
LVKDRRHRVGDISVARYVLDHTPLLRHDEGVPARQGQRPVWRRALPVAAAFVIGGLATGLIVRPWSGAPLPPVRRSVHQLPADVTLPGNVGVLVALSPDGQTLIYRGSENVFRLYKRTLDQLDATAIPGTENAGPWPFLSPDGKSLGFIVGTTLMRVELAGGRPQMMAELPEIPRGSAWGPDGTIIAALPRGGLVRVLASGGDAVSVIKPEDGREFWDPQILPGGEVLVTASFRKPDAGDAVVVNLDRMEQKVVIRGAVGARYVPTGHLVFVRRGDLWAVPFDSSRLEASGEPVLVEEGVRVEPGGAVQVALGNDGTLAYLPGGVAERTLRRLVWVDRGGREEPIPAPLRSYVYPRLSPDGKRVAFWVQDQQNDVWIWDFEREALVRFTFEPGQDSYPVWTPNGRRLIFSSIRDGQRNLYWLAADGTGSAERLTTS